MACNSLMFKIIYFSEKLKGKKKEEKTEENSEETNEAAEDEKK